MASRARASVHRRRAAGLSDVHGESGEAERLVHQLSRRLRPQAGAALRRVGHRGEASGLHHEFAQRQHAPGRRVRPHSRRDSGGRNARSSRDDRPPGVGSGAVRALSAIPPRTARRRASRGVPESVS